MNYFTPQKSYTTNLAWINSLTSLPWIPGIAPLSFCSMRALSTWPRLRWACKALLASSTCPRLNLTCWWSSAQVSFKRASSFSALESSCFLEGREVDLTVITVLYVYNELGKRSSPIKVTFNPWIETRLVGHSLFMVSLRILDKCIPPSNASHPMET